MKDPKATDKTVNKPIPTIVLGGTGYVAGELLRLIAAHPQLELAAAVSESQAGETIKSVFPHLQNVFGEQSYISRDQVIPALIILNPFNRWFRREIRVGYCHRDPVPGIDRVH